MSQHGAAFQYVGSELELFAQALRWKAYWAAVVRRFVRGDVLDVGAGIGSNIAPLMNGDVRSWTALEPDEMLVARMREQVANGGLPPITKPVAGSLDDLRGDALFDTIIYIDVMEHIENDHAQAAQAAERLTPGGHLIILVPAHQYLYSPFDAAIGHHRRYSRASLLALAPPGCRLEMARMLDSVGFFASLANKLLLRAAQPSAAQIGLWDKFMVPLSRIADPLLAYRFGKTALAVWRRV